MPLYEYKCIDCASITTDFRTVDKRNSCPSCVFCGEPTKKIFSKLGPPNFSWPEGGVTMENCEANPVHFETRTQAKNYAKKHKMELGCL